MNVKSLRLPPELVEKITEWRSRRRPIPSQSQAVRELIEIGLAASDQGEVTARPAAK